MVLSHTVWTLGPQVVTHWDEAMQECYVLDTFPPEISTTAVSGPAVFDSVFAQTQFFKQPHCVSQYDRILYTSPLKIFSWTLSQDEHKHIDTKQIQLSACKQD